MKYLGSFPAIFWRDSSDLRSASHGLADSQQGGVNRGSIGTGFDDERPWVRGRSGDPPSQSRLRPSWLQPVSNVEWSSRPKTRDKDRRTKYVLPTYSPWPPCGQIASQ